MVQAQAGDANQQLWEGFVQSIIRNNEENAAYEGLTLLAKLVENKVKNPEEAKYNKFKRSNARIATTIMSLQGGINDLITAMGFSATADDFYEFTGDLRNLKKAFKVIETQLEPMKVARMNPEDRRKHELIQQQRREYAA